MSFKGCLRYEQEGGNSWSTVGDKRKTYRYKHQYGAESEYFQKRGEQSLLLSFAQTFATQSKSYSPSITKLPSLLLWRASLMFCCFSLPEDQILEEPFEPICLGFHDTDEVLSFASHHRQMKKMWNQKIHFDYGRVGSVLRFQGTETNTPIKTTTESSECPMCWMVPAVTSRMRIMPLRLRLPWRWRAKNTPLLRCVGTPSISTLSCYQLIITSRSSSPPRARTRS